MGMTIGREEAVAVLGDSRLRGLVECHERAWDQYVSRIRPILPLCAPGGTATFLHELVVQEARELFLGVRGVVVRDQTATGGRFLIEVDRRLLLSFKKLTHDFRTRNNPTDTSLSFDNQEPGVEGLPDLPRVTVGYHLDQFNTSLSGVFLAFVIGQEPAWHVDLKTGESSLEIEFPRPEESAAAAERRTAAERQAAQRRQTGGTSDRARHGRSGRE